MPYPVKWYTHNFTGVHVENSATPGDFIEIIRDCLITGFNAQVPTGITYDSNVDECTATFGSAHGYLQWQIVTIGGANEAAFNGEVRVLRQTATTITWIPETTPPATATTGSAFSALTSPVGGWTIVEEDVPGYRMVLGRTNPDATPYYIVIKNDTDYCDVPGQYNQWTAGMDIVWQHQYTDIDNHYVARSERIPAGWRNASNSNWSLLADDLMFYWNHRHATNSRISTYCYGDINTLIPGDTGHFTISSHQISASDSRWTNSGYRSHNMFGYSGSAGNWARYLMTDWTQKEGIINCYLLGFGSSAMSDELTYPNAADGGYYYANSPCMIVEGSTASSGTLRGFYPGLVQPLMRFDGLHQVIVDNCPNFDGALIFNTLTMYENENNAPQYMIGFRLDNWRQSIG